MLQKPGYYSTAQTKVPSHIAFHAPYDRIAHYAICIPNDANCIACNHIAQDSMKCLLITNNYRYHVIHKGNSATGQPSEVGLVCLWPECDFAYLSQYLLLLYAYLIWGGIWFEKTYQSITRLLHTVQKFSISLTVCQYPVHLRTKKVDILERL